MDQKGENALTESFFYENARSQLGISFGGQKSVGFAVLSTNL